MTNTTQTKESINASFEANSYLKANVTEMIKIWTGMDVKFSFKALYSQQDAYFVSEELADQMTPRLFDSASINVRLFLREDGDIACDAQYRYEHFSGGGNGMTLGAMTISKNGKKIIEQETVQARAKRIQEEDAEQRAYWKAQSVVEAFEKKNNIK